MRFAEPVSRNRPGRGSLSTAALIAKMRLGARWTSSMTARSNPRHETDGIGSGSIEDSSVVERDERHVGARNTPRQGGLSRLPRTTDENDSRVGERLPDTAFDEARVQVTFP